MMNDGIVIVDKKEGITSHEVVSYFRKKFDTPKVGHSGTLDPFATGVMVVSINRGTKILHFLSAQRKNYHVTAELGKITDTFDISGKVKEINEVTNENLLNLESVVMSFIGKYKQTTPAYSARRYQGKRLYEYARQGKIISLPIKEVEIFSVEEFMQNEKEFSFTVSVSSGTYIRSLIMDIGYKLGCGAVATKLRRLKSGSFDISQSKKMEDISFSDIINIENSLDFPQIRVFDGTKVINGIQIFKNDIMSYDEFTKGSYLRLFDENNEFLGLGVAEKNSSFMPFLLNSTDRNDRVVKIFRIMR